MKKLLIILFVSALLMELLSQIYFRSDPEISNVEKWVSKQEEVISSIGKGLSFNTRGKTIVNSSRTRPGYKVYKFYVGGSKGNGVLVVEVSVDGDMVIKSLIVD
ncbi:hypothetical protein [Marinobacterium rhizophilum]|uniref:Uncharacterized protein n=1 Tax=Marinobacterium rhizophilum TaxID=420402 RepID=A0ABY5HKP4_9GAMM|nr:hypothetical protein [Marinobacterium rhizophilum]UTW11526.1 hypothetical protein KDW95_20085 [Marinobacterium rhizophilum]